MRAVRIAMPPNTDGHDILMRHVPCAWASVTEFTLPARFTIPTHDHPVPHVMVVLRGSFIEATAAGPAIIATGDVRYSPGRDVHTMRTGPGPTSCLVVEARGFPELRMVDRVYVPAADAVDTVAGVRAALYDAEYASPACVEAAALRLFSFVRDRCRDPRVRHHAWVETGRELIES
jgi:hypothetical protein